MTDQPACATCGDSKTVWVKAHYSLDVAPCPDCTGEKEVLRPIPAISRRVAAACGSPTLQALFREDPAVHDFLVRFTEDARTWAGIPPIYRTMIEYAEKELVTIPVDRAASNEMDAYMLAQHQKEPITIIKPAWILCSERMPEHKQRVLLAWREVEGAGYGHYDDTREQWLCGGDELMTPTHWMPLPPGPPIV